VRSRATKVHRQVLLLELPRNKRSLITGMQHLREDASSPNGAAGHGGTHGALPGQ